MTAINYSEPLIFDIAKSSFVDGPGIRTTVFFKGCPLCCPWCHNPESQSYIQETMHSPERCIQCGNCKQAKPCFTRARQVVGKTYSPEQLARIVLQDLTYFKTSGGGVTFSGGEAMGFARYLVKVIPFLKERDIHIAVQTCGYFDFDHFAQDLLSCTDIVYFDFKIMDDAYHQRILGRSNRRILENFTRLLDLGIPLVPRIPLIPHYIANKKNLASIAGFFLAHGIRQCEFLYYHPGGREKLIRLKREPCRRLPERAMPMDENKAWIAYFKGKMNNG